MNALNPGEAAQRVFGLSEQVSGVAIMLSNDLNYRYPEHNLPVCRESSKGYAATANEDLNLNRIMHAGDSWNSDQITQKGEEPDP